MSCYEQLPASDPDMQPLDFWRSNRNVYPLLSTLVLKYLSSTATSCSSERFFSLTGHIYSKKRASYKPERVNMLGFLAFNLKKYNFG